MVSLRKLITATPVVNSLARAAYRLVVPTPVFRSVAYWDARYRNGETSGAGSYGRLGLFKADILNSFVSEHNINKVIEFGCGDGSQLSLAKYPSYVGIDVSERAINICEERFRADKTKSFHLYGNIDRDKIGFDLSLSLDVIYHLVEDEVFFDYMRQLTTFSFRYICIYSSNYDDIGSVNHVRHRRFTDWMDAHAKEWRLLSCIKNDYPYNPERPMDTSDSDFYFFERSRT